MKARIAEDGGDARAVGSLEDLLGYHLRRASILDLASFARELGDEIKPVPFTVLCLIHEEPGITAAEICRLVGLQRANIVSLLAELEQRGLIERRTDREDLRVQRLHLSEQGLETLGGWWARAMAQEQATLGLLTASERSTLRRLLAKVWKRG